MPLHPSAFATTDTPHVHHRSHSITHVQLDHFRFFPIYHLFQLGALCRTVLCRLYALFSKTLIHCLLPPPDSATASIALCTRFLLQALQPCNVFVQEQFACFPHRVSRRNPCNVPTPRNIACEVRFITMRELVFRPAVAQEPGPSRHVGFSTFITASWYINRLSQHSILHCAQVCTLCTFKDPASRAPVHR